MITANKSKDDQVVTLLAALAAKDLQIDKFVAKLTAASVGGGSGGGGNRGGNSNLKTDFPSGFNWLSTPFNDKWPIIKQNIWNRAHIKDTDITAGEVSEAAFKLKKKESL